MLSTESMLGLIVEVFATFIVIFVILGAFLENRSWRIDYKYCLSLDGSENRWTWTAVIGGGFFGMISGSGVANVMTTGTFTVPLMKRVGYA